LAHELAKLDGKPLKRFDAQGDLRRDGREVHGVAQNTLLEVIDDLLGDP